MHQALGGRYLTSGHLIYGFHGTLSRTSRSGSTRGHRSPGSVGCECGADEGNAGMGCVPLLGVGRRDPCTCPRLLREKKRPRLGRSPGPWTTSSCGAARMNTRISPNGQRVALDLRDQQADVWVWEFARSALTRLTSAAKPADRRFGAVTDSRSSSVRHAIRSSICLGNRQTELASSSVC